MTLIGLQKDYDLAPYHPKTQSHQQFKVICDSIFVLKSLTNVNFFDFDEKKLMLYSTLKFFSKKVIFCKSKAILEFLYISKNPLKIKRFVGL